METGSKTIKEEKGLQNDQKCQKLPKKDDNNRNMSRLESRKGKKRAQNGQ